MAEPGAPTPWRQWSSGTWTVVYGVSLLVLVGLVAYLVDRAWSSGGSDDHPTEGGELVALATEDGRFTMLVPADWTSDHTGDVVSAAPSDVAGDHEDDVASGSRTVAGLHATLTGNSVDEGSDAGDRATQALSDITPSGSCWYDDPRPAEFGPFDGSVVGAVRVGTCSPQFAGDVGVIVFMEPDATEAEIDDVHTDLEGDRRVREVTYCDQQCAYDEFQELFGDDPQLTENVTADRLPSSFKVTPVDDDDGLEALGTELATRSGVREVVYDSPSPLDVTSFGSLVSVEAVVIGADGTEVFVSGSYEDEDTKAAVLFAFANLCVGGPCEPDLDELELPTCTEGVPTDCTSSVRIGLA